MDDEEEIVRELRKLESLDDDLYLGDVDASWAGAGRGGVKSKRGRAARGGGNRGVSRGRPSRNQGHLSQGRLSDDDIDRNDLNNFDNWDLEQEEGNSEKHREDDSSFDSRRGGYRGRSRPFERREAANTGHKSFGRGKPVHDKTRFDDYKMSDTFDIESNQQRGDSKHLDRGWSRDSRGGVVSGRAQAYDEADMKIDEKGGFIVHRKDPRLSGRPLENETRSSPKISDPRISDGTGSSETYSQRKDLRSSGHPQQASRGKDPKSELLYENLMKDPRLMAQQVEKLRKEKEAVERDIAEREKALAQSKSDSRMSSKSSEHPRGFENRFMPVRIDARPQGVDYNKAPTEKTIFEKISNNPVLLVNQIPGIGKDLVSPDAPVENVRRGPRSPSPVRSVSPVGKKVRNGSPSSRKRERSPVKNRSSRWERSTSPSRGRRDQSPSPRRRSSRKERSNSRDRRGERSHDRRDWSGSPRRERSRRDRSPSPRRRHRSRSRSSSRDHSPSSRRSPPSARQQHQRDISSETAAPPVQATRYPPPPQSGYDMPPPNMYGDQYQQQPPGYGGLPPGFPPAVYPHPAVNTWAVDVTRHPPPLPFVNWPATGFPTPHPYPEPRSTAPDYFQPQGLPYAPYQQQQYQQYDNYGYPQQPYGDYQQQQHQQPQQAPPPPMGAWGNDRQMMYPDMSQPPPPAQAPPPAVAPPPPTPAPPVAPPPPKVDVKAEEAKKEAAIKNEKLQQKQTLTKQREEYIRKSSMISRELQLLKNQEEELREENSRDNERILRENNKLQLEITNKLKAINNVIDMLTGIIGDKKELEEKKRAKIEKTEKKHPKTPPDTPPKSSSSSGSSPTLSAHANGSEPPVPGESMELLPPPPPPIKTAPAPPPTAVAPPPLSSDDSKPQFNYVHYDPEMHWCRVCDVFPRTAKEFLNHLHSSEHKEETLERKMVDMPWHKVPNMEMEVPHHKGAPTKRTPIRGLQFFISATAWYCKLCDVWIGDLHCASLHLKSKTHTENYVNFTVQSPHWETDWLADREKAYERKADERRQLRDTAPDLATTGMSPSIGKPLLKDLVIKDEKAVKKSKKDRKKERRAKDEKEGKKKKRRKKGKKKAKNSSGSDSSSSSSSDNSSDEDSDIESDKGKSIRVAMRNKMKAMENEQLIKELPAAYLRPAGGWQTLDSKEEAERSAREQVEQEERLGRELREKYLKEVAEQQLERERIEHERYERMMMEKEEREGKFRKVPQKEDKMLREWMSANKELPDGEKQILSNIKDRMKLRQEAEKERKYDQRDRYYENRYYDDRRKRRGDSPDGRMGKRGRSRSPEERRWDKNRGGDRSQGKYNKRSPPRPKVESRFQDAREEPAERKNSGDKKQVTKRVDAVEQDEAETKFERQAAEAAARLKKKDKKPTVAAIPKSKLPFIGRMPIMKHLAKKKGEDESIEMKNKVTDVPASQSMIGPALPPSMLAMQALIQPPLPEKGHAEDLGAGAVVQDMDIDDDDSNPGESPVVEEQVPVSTFDELIPVKQPPLPEVKKAVIPDILPEEETSIVDDVMESKETAPNKKPVNDIPLPKDFQEALNILFPGQTKAGEEPPKQETPTPPPPPHNSQWNQDVISSGPPHPLSGYGHGPMMGMQGIHPMFQQGGMMPQGMNGPPGFQMPMQGMMGREMQGPPLPTGDRPRAERMPQRKVKADSDSSSDEDGGQDKFKSEMSEDDLAMLGIDAGDMAAQSF